MPRISSFYFDEAKFKALPADEQLWHCVQQNELSRARDLLDAGVGPNKKMGVWMQTPLHHAVKNHALPMVELLLERFCDVDERDICGTTPLMLAVEWNDFWVVNGLMKRGANADRKNSEGLSPMMMAQDVVDQYGAESERFPDAGAILFDMQKKLHRLPKRGADGGGSSGVMDQYLARLLHDDGGAGPGGARQPHHTLSHADKDRLREKKGERELRAERAAKAEVDHLAAHYSADGHGT